MFTKKFRARAHACPTRDPTFSLATYQLYNTTTFAFQLYANIDSFSCNTVQGWRGAAVVQQNADGLIAVISWRNNHLSPWERQKEAERDTRFVELGRSVRGAGRSVLEAGVPEVV
jgi:hypothetical protein